MEGRLDTLYIPQSLDRRWTCRFSGVGAAFSAVTVTPAASAAEEAAEASA
jgi:hypothetical protein